MPLQIRRGTTAQISGITPLIGELIYDTQLKKVIVGDGTTAGGISATAGVSIEEAKDASADSLISGTHNSISFSYNGVTKALSASLNINSDLDLNGFNIITNPDSNINISSSGTGNLVLQGITINPTGNIRKIGQLNISPTQFLSLGNAAEGIPGNIFVTRDTYSTGFTDGFTFAQHHDTSDAVDFKFFRTRGSPSLQGDVQIGDDLADIVFFGKSPGTPVPAQGATISIQVDGPPAANQIPVKFQFNTSNGISFGPRAELSSAGVWKVDQIEGLNSSLNVIGDLKGSVFADDSSKIIDGTDGTITSPSITIANLLLLPGGTLVNSAGNIRKTTPGPISIAPSSFVAFGSAGENIPGNIFITRSNYSTSPNEGFTFAQHHNTADAVDFRFLRTRGSAASQTAVTINDSISDIVFLGLSPGSPIAAAGAILSVVVDDTPVLGQVPVKFQFNTSNGISFGPRAELSSAGVWKVDQIEGLNSSLNVIGDFKGSVFADDSSKIIDGTDGRITSPSVTISSFLQLPVYDNDTARDAAIPFPNKGMVIMVENRDDSTEDSTVLNKLQFYNGTTWIDL